VLRSPALGLSLVALAWSVGWPFACSATESFVCDADVQCVTDDAAGRCEPEGVCSFPDEACPSGHRYGKLGGELAGECVEVGSSGGGTDPGATSVVPGTTTSPGDDSTGPSATSTSTTASTSSSSATSTSSTSEPETGTETTGPSGTDPYGPCKSDAECPVEGSFCIPSQNGGRSSVCSPPCDMDPCTYEGMAQATPTCVPVTPDFQGCILRCDVPDECPAGMVCEEIMAVGFGYCTWPAP
jgi:hypothetical protein